MLYQGDWFVEQCRLCCSINHIFVSVSNAYVWQCHCCGSQTWLSMEDKERYIDDNNVAHSMADYELAEHIVYPSLAGLLEKTED
jgi:hypothetical protein